MTSDAEKKRLEEIEEDLVMRSGCLWGSDTIVFLLNLINRRQGELEALTHEGRQGELEQANVGLATENVKLTAALTVARWALLSVQFEEEQTDCLTSYCRDIVNDALTQLDAIAKAEAVVEVKCHKNTFGWWVAMEDEPLVRRSPHKGILIVLKGEGEHE